MIDRQGDRRHSPRRTEDARSHYATEALLAAAVGYVEACDEGGLDDQLVTQQRLQGAVRRWKAAHAEAVSA